MMMTLPPSSLGEPQVPRRVPDQLRGAFRRAADRGRGGQLLRQVLRARGRGHAAVGDAHLHDRPHHGLPSQDGHGLQLLRGRREGRRAPLVARRRGRSAQAKMRAGAFVACAKLLWVCG
eukprot:scaffold94841_cov55-Phaeocystis_antarctica.AAC.3